MAARVKDLGELILTYDPLHPQPEFFPTASALAAARAAPRLPVAVPWPAGGAPFADPPSPAPAPDRALPRCDVLVVTWTVAEARALATLFTPGVALEGWFEYRHNVADFLPKVTGARAPFNSRGPNDSNRRYFHTLGLYHPCRIGPARVLCFKSGLHFAYDGPQVPVQDLWKQIIDETGCSLVITTGTAGGVGANVKLGDVIVARHTVFDCMKAFRSRPFAHSSTPTSPIAARVFTRVTRALLQPNADQLPPGTGLPAILRPRTAASQTPNIITTDFFAYDDTADSAHLQALGSACEMGDAVLGLAMQGRPNGPTWLAIRNASDPQMDASLPKPQRDAAAARIYQRYGTFTTAGSVLATWAVIRHAFPGAAPHAAPPAATAAPAPEPPPPDPAGLLLTLVSGRDLTARDVPAGAVPRPTRVRLQALLREAQVPYASSDISYREVSFTDEMESPRRLHVAHVSNDDAESFRGSYLFEGGRLIVKQEFVSS